MIDEYTPLGSSRPQINPGLYFPQLPKLHRLQLRLEGLTTDLNIPPFFGIGSVYTNLSYRSGYTNNGVLLGSWIGRGGRGEQGWATYSFSPRTQIQFGYRHNNVDPDLLQGGTLQDMNLRAICSCVMTLAFPHLCNMNLALPGTGTNRPAGRYGFGPADLLA